MYKWFIKLFYSVTYFLNTFGKQSFGVVITKSLLKRNDKSSQIWRLAADSAERLRRVIHIWQLSHIDGNYSPPKSGKTCNRKKHTESCWEKHQFKQANGSGKDM